MSTDEDIKLLVVMFTASGLLVRFLKVFEKSGYQSVKWVRYLSKANGSYQIRVSGFFGCKRVWSSAVLKPCSFDVYHHVVGNALVISATSHAVLT